MADADEAVGGFLTRWSERKLGSGDRIDAGELSAERVPDTAALPEADDEREHAPVLTDADMPPLESLGEGSDYSGFLSGGVSADLRRKALSKLFHGARFNQADGLDDYAEDFTGFLPLGDIVTADMRHRMEEAAKRLLAGEGEAVEVGAVADEEEAEIGAASTSRLPASAEGEVPSEDESA